MARPGHPVIPPSRRSLAEVQADDSLSNGARRLAAHLDGRCLAFGKWAAWPKVSTIAAELGWGGDPRAFRKRVERSFRELIDSGDVARPRLGELVAWHDAEGARIGVEWPKGLRRGLCRSAAICVLGWKLAEAEAKLPSLTACDILVASGASAPPAVDHDDALNVACHPPGILPSLTACDIPVASGVSGDPAGVPAAPPNVACHPPEMSHGDTPEMSHLQNVRNGNVQSEPTLDDDSALASRGKGPTVDTGPAPGVANLPRPAWTDRELAEKFFLRLVARGLVLKLGFDSDRGDVIHPVPFGGAEPIRPDEVAELLRLRPHLIAFLKREPAAKPAPPKPGGGPRPRPKVPPGVRATIRAKISGLTLGGATNRDVAAAAKSLVDALGPHADHGKTVAKFHCLCGQLRKGSIPEATLQDAFEAACGKKAENRGAVFVALVKRATQPIEERRG